MTYIPDKEGFGSWQMIVQVSPAAPNVPEVIYSPGVDEEVHIKAWTLTNHNNNQVEFKVYFDVDGTDATNAELVFIGSVNRDEATPAGNLAVFLNDTDNSISFEADDIQCTLTLWGVIYDLS